MLWRHRYDDDADEALVLFNIMPICIEAGLKTILIDEY